MEGGRDGRRKVWEGRHGVGGKEEGMGRRKRCGGGRDREEEGMGRKVLGGGNMGRRKNWEEEGIERKRRDGRRVDGIWEDRTVMTGRSHRDDGKAGL